MKLFVDYRKFTKIWKDLQHRNTELFLLWCANNFMFPARTVKTGKKPEIKRQTFVIWWLNSRKYRSAWYLLSCTETLICICFLFWRLDLHNNFIFLTCKNNQKRVKIIIQKRQSFIIWCLNSRKYRSVWYLWSCIQLVF